MVRLGGEYPSNLAVCLLWKKTGWRLLLLSFFSILSVSLIRLVDPFYLSLQQRFARLIVLDVWFHDSNASDAL